MKFANWETHDVPWNSPLRVVFSCAGAVCSAEDCEQAEQVFDSARHAAGRDIRSGAASGRQLLYKPGNICIDMHMQSRPGSDSLVLIGQLLDSERPGHGLRDVSVALLCEGDTISYQTTNDFGEFDFGIETPHHLQLVFGIEQRRPLVVSMPDMQVDPWSAIS